MSNLDNNYDKILKDNNLKENERNENSATCTDSLHTNKTILNESNGKYLFYKKQKERNYFLALNTVQNNLNDTLESLFLNEYSEVSQNNTKEKNIKNYINNPIVKEVIKAGNIIKNIKPIKTGKSIATLKNHKTYNLFQKFNISKIIEKKIFPKAKETKITNKNTTISSQESVSHIIYKKSKKNIIKIKNNKISCNLKKNNTKKNINIDIKKDNNKMLNKTTSLNKENNNNKNTINNKNLSTKNLKNKKINKVNNINKKIKKLNSNKIILYNKRRNKNNNDYLNDKNITKSSSTGNQTNFTDKKPNINKKIENNNQNKNDDDTDNTKNNMQNKLDIIKNKEESVDIKSKDEESKKQKINKQNGIISKNIFDIEKNGILNVRMKSFDFKNLRIHFSLHEIEHFKKWSNVEYFLKNKNFKMITDKKLRKKYQRSEFMSYRENSNTNDKNKNLFGNPKNNSLNIKVDIKKELENKDNCLSNDKLPKNLMGNFDICFQEGNDMNNILNINSNEKSKNKNEKEEINNNSNAEAIDFLSKESGNNKENMKTESKDSSNINNDTVIIKASDKKNDLENEKVLSDNSKIKNSIEKEQRNNNDNLNQSNNIYDSPSKIRNYAFFPFDIKNLSHLINKKAKKNNDNIILKDMDKNEILDISDSKSNNNSLNKKNIIKTKEKNLSNKELENNFPKQLQHSIYDLEFYRNLLNANNTYKKIDLNKIFKKQPLVTIEERLNSLLWMMKICEEFAFKRDTYHYSCFYFDLYLFLKKEKIQNINELKLIGITCLSISAKIEEVQIPKLDEYADTINLYYKIDDIISTEQKICKMLGWKLIPMTILGWLNWYTCQWDLFVHSVDRVKEKLLLLTNEDNILLFKKQNEASFYNYRRIYQIIDLVMLDYNSYIYGFRHLVAASLLIIICLHYDLEYDFNKKILKNKKKKKHGKKNTGKIILEIYVQFIGQSFDFSLENEELNECINYVYKFINFKFTYFLPLIFQLEQEHMNDYSYEDFISYQTFNDNISPFFKEMIKNEKKKLAKKNQGKASRYLYSERNNILYHNSMSTCVKSLNSK